jgi:hypothetical protein
MFHDKVANAIPAEGSLEVAKLGHLVKQFFIEINVVLISYLKWGIKFE